MKLVRFGEKGQERPGVKIGEKIVDLSGFVGDYDENFFEKTGIAKLKQIVSDHLDTLPEVTTCIRLGCPVARPSKIVCTGLNYKDHAIEMVQDLPAEPVIFLKSTSAITGPFDEIVIPRGSKKTDWEVELAIVIEKKCSYVSESAALESIAGFMIHNDVSEREFQLERNGTWGKGKGCDTFAPLGPYLVTPDEIADLDKLQLWLKLNGTLMQRSSTASMIFKIPYIISYISQFMTLLPGDIISTGSPSGVGKGQNPPFYLKPGDIVELGIDGLGESRQKVVSCSEQPL
ncbi:fumarylacetoacetate hydrolase family protein [Pedobacter sp. SYSU D00535]|uniref:fumarylacetoacetate hydrolase family protein n=1 Tax=Pedobacter sp. SYSU D00535 TaxID=2810308 RepID=UPI001A967FE2|nr:fumarylacetoacetate hydrolase family protein [Pedobacter sp. SYSU D00535]